MIYVDESGVSTQMTRMYGRARKGGAFATGFPAGNEDAFDPRPHGFDRHALADGDVFLAFLDHVLCPKLRSGHVVVMDNLSAHKVDGVRERIEASGASVLYLPPYSPDLNLIEKAWSKLKASLRAIAARALPQLEHGTTAQALQV